MEQAFLYHCQHISAKLFHVWHLEFISHGVNAVFSSIDPLLPIRHHAGAFYKCHLIYLPYMCKNKYYNLHFSSWGILTRYLSTLPDKWLVGKLWGFCLNSSAASPGYSC